VVHAASRTHRKLTGAVLGTALALLAGGASAHAAGPVTVAQWRFDEGAGQTVFDDGPFGLAGTLGSSDGPDANDPQRIAGASGGALRFSDGQFVRLPDSPQLAPQTLTVEAVVRAPTSPGAWRYVFSRGGDGCFSGSYGFYSGAAGGMALYVFDGSHYVVSATARPSDVWDGEWHHVAGTFDGRQLRLYVDGRPVGDPMDAPLTIDYATTADFASIGAYAGACDLPFRGDIDLVRLTAGALGSAAIADAARTSVPDTIATEPSTPLPPAATGTVLTAPPAGTPPAPVAPPTAPAAPRACVVRLSRTAVTVRRRTTVRARISGVGRATVIARDVKDRKTIARARATRGLARLVVTARRAGRLTVSVSGRPSCAPARLTASIPKSH
jgi:Concanavalin A-like lectin/glucanases superfamily